MLKKCLANCIECFEHNIKERRNGGFLHNIEKGNTPWQTLHIEHFGPLTRIKRGYKHILAIIDGFSKFIIIEPAKSTNSEETIKILRPIFKIFGNP